MKKQALLIGINKYEILLPLKYARQDAEAVEQSLKYNYCFSDDEVMLLTDARSGIFKPTNRLRILSHLDNLANQDLDLFVFGFWGHGVVRNGKRYLCPLDVSPDDVEQLGVPFDVLMDKLSKIRAKNTCLILDCCQRVHDGERGEEETLTAADEKAIENAARDIVLRRKETEPEFVSNVAILNSCKEGQAAYEWDNRKHGIFTAHLLDAMNRRYDSVAQIVGYVSSNVEKTAKSLNKQQTPLCRLEGDIPLPVDTKTTALETGDVFISYRRCNAALVAPIEEELKKRNISYFIDRVGVDYSMEYAEALALAVKACKVLLFVWTQDANDSHDILREVSMALALKKRVLPYKIGEFNVTEHGSLFYQLSPICRYEVPRQTPETVVELVNQVQQALTGKTFQQYTFALPEKSQDAVIQKPVVEEINVTVTPRIIEQQQAIQYKEITLPPLPEELLKIRAENQGLQETIEQLKSFTHESLSQANAAVAQAQAQFDAWSERKERLWKDLPNSTRQTLEKTIANNPSCTELDIKAVTDALPDDEYFDFIEKFQCGKKYEQAKRELQRVERERASKCDEAIAKFQQKIEDNNALHKERSNALLDEVIMTILAVMPGCDDVNAPFPEDQILAPLHQLDDYKLGWKPKERLSRARTLWSEQRPCIVKAEAERVKQIQLQAQREKDKQNRRKILFFGSIAGFVAVIIALCCISSVMKNVREWRLEEERISAQQELKQKVSELKSGQTAGERKVVTVNGVEFAFRWCPAGTFTMGAPTSEEGLYNETQHEVTLTKGFWMLETEVTQKQWKAVMGTNPSFFKGDDLPVESVSWNDCQEFCEKTGLQLPTEAQWEYACRAGTTDAYAGNLDEMAWYYSNSGNKTHPVGTKKPNAWGLYDMHGNVWEWCQDWYGDYPSGSVTDPTGPSSGYSRVVRGGSWDNDARICRSALRDGVVPGDRGNYLGFRVVQGQ